MLISGPGGAWCAGGSVADSDGADRWAARRGGADRLVVPMSGEAQTASLLGLSGAGPAFARNGSADLLPLDRDAFLASQEARLPPRSGLTVQADRPVALRPPSRPHWAASATVQENDMAQIGTFTRDEYGAYSGTIKTLTINVKASIKPCDRDNDKAPTTGSRPTASSSAQGGAEPPARPEPNTYRSSSTTRPSRPPSTPPWSRATKANTSSSGRAEPAAPPATSGAPRLIPWDYAEQNRARQPRKTGLTSRQLRIIPLSA